MASETDLPENAWIIHPRDNVAVVLRSVTSGEMVRAAGADPFPALEDIPVSHKIALREIAAGEEIIKYGQPVAVSTCSIRKGEWVHTHNLESGRWSRKWS